MIFLASVVFFNCLPPCDGLDFRILLKSAEKSPAKAVTIFHCTQNDLEFQRDLRGVIRELSEFGGTARTYDLLQPIEEIIDDFLEFRSVHTHVWLDLGCPNVEPLLEAVSQNKMFNGSRKFIFHSSSLNDSWDLVQRQNVNLDSDVILMTEDTGKIHRVKCLEAWRHTPFELAEIGYFSANETRLKSGLVKLSSIDLHGLMLFASFNVPHTPKGAILMEYMKGGFGSLDNTNRMGNKIFMLFAELFNFRIHWVRTTSWGFKGPNNTWTGAVLMMNRGDVNFSTCALMYMPFRHPVIDTGFGSIPLRHMFLFRHPKPGMGDGNPFIQAVSPRAWLAIIGASILVIVLVYIIKLYYTPKETEVSEILLDTVGVLTQQGMHSTEEEKMHVKVVILLFHLLAFFIFQFYSAYILGNFLTVAPKTITNFAKFLKSDIKVALENIPSAVPYMNFVEEGTKLYEQRVKGQEVFVPMAEGVKYVKKGGWAFFGYIDPAYDLIRQTFTPDEIDDLQEVTLAKELQLHFAMKKFTPYKEMIRHGSLRMIESGIMEYWKLKWVPPPPKGNIHAETIVNVDFAHTKSAFFVLFWAYLASFMVLLLEIVVKRSQDAFKEFTFVPER